MKPSWLIVLGLLLILVCSAHVGEAQEPGQWPSGTGPSRVNGEEAGSETNPPATSPPAQNNRNGGQRAEARRLPEPVEGSVYVIPIEGTIDEGLAVFVRRALAEAEQAKAAAVLLEINTFGGRVDSATDIKDAIGRLDIPVIAFVTQRAWSAGALISLGAPFIAMTPGSSIGAAEPRPAEEKTISALRREFEAAAEQHGRDPRLAGAMVDARIAVEGVVDAGEILTLSAHQARNLNFIDFVGVRRTEVLTAFGVVATEWVEATMNWAERAARFLTDPYISSLLLTLGFLGLLSEITSPGWGVPGTAGILMLGLFFGARLVAGLAGMELILLFAIGLSLIALELFVIPGFGLAGLGGIAALLASIFFAFPDAATAINSMAAALVGTILLAIVVFRFLPRSRGWQRLVLQTQVGEAEEDRRFRAEQEGDAAALAPGRVGKALTPLRPAGTIEVAGKRFDAVTEGGFVPVGADVRVVGVEGRRIIVRKLGD